MANSKLLERIIPPIIDLNKIPAEERDASSGMNMNIVGLQMRVREFWAGVELFNFCAHHAEESRKRKKKNDEEILDEWIRIPARHCAMSIYHFGKLTEGIHETLGPCPQVRDIIDKTELRRARKLFDYHFPDYIQLRHSISHAAETMNTPKAIEKHSIKGPAKVAHSGFRAEFGVGSSVIISEMLRGSRYSSSWEGEIVSCDVTYQTGVALEAVRDAYWSALKAITVMRDASGVIPQPTSPG